MSDAPKKSIDELTQDVLASGIGLLSDKDLETLFGDIGAVPQRNPETPLSPPPVAAIATPGIQDPKPGEPGTPAIAEPDVLSQIPEEFRDKDVPTSLGKITKSIAEAKAAASQKDKEIEDLRELVNTLKQPVAPTQTAQTPTDPNADPDDDIDDTMIIEKPKENIKKLIERISARMMVLGLTQYDTLSKRERTIERFSETHPDFNILRPEMAQIVKEYPQLNQDPNALSKIYDIAKLRVTKRNTELAQVGRPVAPAAIVTTPAIDQKELMTKAVEQAKIEILEGLKKRRAASGISSGSPAISQDQRNTDALKTIPQTEEDQIFNAILDSGPSKLSLE